MGAIAGTVATACGMFAATNVDDLIVLTVLFLSGRATGSPRPWQIWAGQYAGIAALVLVSVVAALGLTIVPDEWIGLLGLVPLALGVRGLVAAVRAGDDDGPPAVASGLLPIAGVTIANGADNISAYTPVFRTIGPESTLVTVVRGYPLPAPPRGGESPPEVSPRISALRVTPARCPVSTVLRVSLRP